MKDWKQSVERIINMLPDDIRMKGEEMAESYAYMYVIENVLRLFLDKILRTKYGDNFFDQIASKEAKDAYRVRKSEEQKHQWIGVRGDSPLFYIDFNEITSLIVKDWETFKVHFPDQNWIKVKLDELTKCRNLIAHNSILGAEERQLIRVYFEQIIRQIKLKEPSSAIASFHADSEDKCFIKGLKRSKVFTAEDFERGGEYILDFPAWLEVRPWSIRYFFYQVAVALMARFPQGDLWLPYGLEIGNDPKTDQLYPSAQLQIGQYDIDGDGLDEVFFGIKEEKHAMGMQINVFKYYPPAMPDHVIRESTWELIGNMKGELVVGSPEALVTPSTVHISRKHRGQYWEWTWVKGKFLYTGNF
ncbi:MAG: Swt1 family HEPN domain-containing protein [Bacteroidia bacterium]